MLPSQVVDKNELAQVQALVVSVGTECWLDKASAWAEVGDVVIIAKYSGIMHDGPDKRKYRVVNDLDVIAVVENGDNHE